MHLLFIQNINTKLQIINLYNAKTNLQLKDIHLSI